MTDENHRSKKTGTLFGPTNLRLVLGAETEPAPGSSFRELGLTPKLAGSQTGFAFKYDVHVFGVLIAR